VINIRKVADDICLIAENRKPSDMYKLLRKEPVVESLIQVVLLVSMIGGPSLVRVKSGSDVYYIEFAMIGLAAIVSLGVMMGTLFVIRGFMHRPEQEGLGK
jgi:hypothetical protein